MLLILLFVSIGIFQPTENYCIPFYKDSDIVYKKEDGSGGLVDEKVYLLLEKENGKLLGVPLKDLSIQDQKLANLKINKLNEINQN